MRIHYFDNNNEFYVCISTVQILENVAIEADLEKGEAYFEGSVKFMKTLNEVLDMLIGEVSIINANSILSLSYEDIHFLLWDIRCKQNFFSLRWAHLLLIRYTNILSNKCGV